MNYRDYIYEKAQKVASKEELDILLKEVVNNKNLEYETIVYAISACMLATAKYIDRSEVGGITGFQASFIVWELVRKFMHESKVGMKLVDYEDMLYPQYEKKFEKTISRETWALIKYQAKINLQESPNANPKVIEHWQSIVDGNVPFGYEVVDE